ncbi:MAG: HD domain-containing protein, partial [Dehalococcoidales bacterium]|nr:HD domain-containing protein [Dehalococcoidales bacterium]
GWVATHGEPLIINDASRDSRFDKGVDKATGFETKSVICTPLIVGDRIIGVIEVLNKINGGTFDTHDQEIMMSVASTVALTIDSARIRQGLLDSYKATMLVLAAAVETRDSYARGHAQRVAEYVFLQANSLALSREEKEAIEYAAILHDIGKAYIPDKILLKPGPFTAEEWKIMHKHPAIGANMLKQVPLLVETSKLVLHHHERYDGSGYPSGLKGEAIPLGARLIAVADAFDTMTTSHLYRASYTVDFAIGKLRRSSRTQFCPAAVQTFISGFSKFHFVSG